MKKRHFILGITSLIATQGCSSYLESKKSAQISEQKTFEINKNEEEWRKILTLEQFQVLRKHGTEAPGTSLLNKEYAKGIYVCGGCELPLFSSETKFDSGTGWPSFYEAIINAVGTSQDNTLYSTRTEVHCRRCGGHLGHVFDDGPLPTDKRYCINGVALKFIKA